MTIAQHKINKYCKERKLSRRQFSSELGYTPSYISNILGRVIPSNKEQQVINKVFGIVNNFHSIKMVIEDKYQFITNANCMYNLQTGRNVSYRVFRDWVAGVHRPEKEYMRDLCKVFDIKNEWVEEYKLDK